jgi:predicted PurR-regulated permease PerM
MNMERSPDLTRTLLQVLGIVLMIAACAWILQPFLLAGGWATTIVVATWPLLLKAQGAFGGRRGPAVAVMTVALLVILILPLSAGIAGIVDNVDRIGGWLKSVTTIAVPPPPAWLEGIPLIGPRAVARWQVLANASPEEIAARLGPHARSLLEWFLVQVGSFGRIVVQFLLTVLIAGVLYSTGETAAAGVKRFAARLAGDRGERAVTLAGEAIRAVAIGVVLTAIIQSALGGVGLAIAGIPFAGVLTLLMFFLCICMIGPMPILLCALVWLYWRGDPFWGTVLLVWSIPVGLLDNFLRPILIRRGADISMLLILPGVIGGLLALGIIGLFVGPMVLAVTYRLLSEWVRQGRQRRDVTA